MGRYHLGIFLWVALLLFGCSKNSDDPQVPPKPIDKSANLLGTGDSANDILSNDNFSTLLVEIAYVTGFRPTAETMDNFTAYLRQHTFKTDIQIAYNELPSPNEETLTLQEIADLESDNRTAYNSGNTLAIYIYFADAPSDDDDETAGLVTLGAVYRNTSMIIHEVTIKKLAAQSPLITNADVETATLNHEFGHLFGLVNLGTDSVNEHEDAEAINHCNVAGCLMRAELQFGGFARKSIAEKTMAAQDGLVAGCALSGQSVMELLKGRNNKGLADIPPLDAECVLDLQANGGK